MQINYLTQKELEKLLDVQVQVICISSCIENDFVKIREGAFFEGDEVTYQRGRKTSVTYDLLCSDPVDYDLQRSLRYRGYDLHLRSISRRGKEYVLEIKECIYMPMVEMYRRKYV